MGDSWTCLLVQNGPGMLPDNVCTALKVAACDLHLKKWDEIRLVNDIVEGILKTEWKTYVVGTRSGVLFRAHIDCENGTDYMVNFLLNERDLKKGAETLKQMEESAGGEWRESSTRFPIDELYQFYNLRGPSRQLH